MSNKSDVNGNQDFKLWMMMDYITKEIADETDINSITSKIFEGYIGKEVSVPAIQYVFKFN
jgi:hypothetical protein